jgi:outer membrane protein assembly factor BamD (BamD/ComL family)
VARKALARHDAAAALSALDDYQHRFPRGLLAPEAAVLRIDALAQRGSMGEARSLAKRFLAAHPASPHADHVRSILKGD